MSQEQGVPEYNCDDIEVGMMSPDKQCGLEIWCSNGKHFKLICGKYHRLIDLKDRLTEIMEERSTNFKFLADGNHLIGSYEKLGRFFDPLRFSYLKVMAIRKIHMRDSLPDVAYVNCFFQTKYHSTGGEFVGVKTIEDYAAFIRAKLGLKDLKYYNFTDFLGKPINPMAPLEDILNVGVCRIINIKEKPTPESIMKKLSKLLDWCKENNE